MTLRQNIARRTAVSSMLAEFAATIELCDAVDDVTYAQTFAVSSKAEADRIAKAAGAQTLWRDGYYMAMIQLGTLTVEIHFAPLIIEEAA